MKSNKAIIYGGLAGIGTIIYLMSFYFFDPKVMLSSWVYYSSSIFYLIGMFVTVFTIRKETGGLDFRTALSLAFQCFLVANVVYYLFSYLLFNYIDPTLVDLQKEMMEDYLKGLNDEQGKEMLKQFKDGDIAYTLSKTLFSFALSTISGFVLSLLVAGIGRNK